MKNDQCCKARGGLSSAAGAFAEDRNESFAQQKMNVLEEKIKDSSREK